MRLSLVGPWGCQGNVATADGSNDGPTIDGAGHADADAYSGPRSWDLDQNPVLITAFTTGAPTPYFGATYKTHLQSTF